MKLYLIQRDSFLTSYFARCRFPQFLRRVKCDLMAYDTLGVASGHIINQHGNIDPVVDCCLDFIYLPAFVPRRLFLFWFCCHGLSINLPPAGFNIKHIPLVCRQAAD